jgi:hypothetical protein
MKSPTVKTFDEKAIINALKASGKDDAVLYIKKLKEALENQQRITAKAIKKLKELSKNDS